MLLRKCERYIYFNHVPAHMSWSRRNISRKMRRTLEPRMHYSYKICFKYVSLVPSDHSIAYFAKPNQAILLMKWYIKPTDQLNLIEGHETFDSI